MRHVAAGRKNQKIALYKPVTGKTVSGAPLHNKFKYVISPWASIITKQASEQEVGNAQQSKIIYSVAVGWREVAPGWVVLWKNQLLRISSVDNSDPYHRQIIMLAIAENTIKEDDFLATSVIT